jgi:hypothetical protein
MADDFEWIIGSPLRILSVSNEELLVKSGNQKQRHKNTCVFIWMLSAISWSKLVTKYTVNHTTRESPNYFILLMGCISCSHRYHRATLLCTTIRMTLNPSNRPRRWRQPDHTGRDKKGLTLIDNSHCLPQLVQVLSLYREALHP